MNCELITKKAIKVCEGNQSKYNPRHRSSNACIKNHMHS